MPGFPEGSACPTKWSDRESDEREKQGLGIKVIDPVRWLSVRVTVLRLNFLSEVVKATLQG